MRKDFFPEPGTHRARVENIEPTETSIGEAIKFSYRTDSGPLISEFTGIKYRKGNKLARRLQAILGEEPELPVPLEDLIGRKVEVDAEERSDNKYLRVTEVRSVEEAEQSCKGEFRDEGVPF